MKQVCKLADLYIRTSSLCPQVVSFPNVLLFKKKKRGAKHCPDALHCYKVDSEVSSELHKSKELQLMQSLKLGLQVPILLAWMYF